MTGDGRFGVVRYLFGRNAVGGFQRVGETAETGAQNNANGRFYLRLLFYIIDSII